MDKMELKMVSFVIPCYRSEITLPKVVKELQETMEQLAQYRYEIILVNDCSPDNTWNTIRQLCQDDRIRGISMAKNFGQHSALMAGFCHTKGEYVIALDDDGQTPANEAGKLLEALENGADAVYASYEHKKHTAFRNWGSHLNERMLRHMLNKPKELYVSSYFGVKRFVVDEMVRYKNCYPYVLGLVLRSTKNIVNVPVNHRQREVGNSGYTFQKLVTLWFNGFTAFSIKPLRIATCMGAGFAAIAFLYGIFTIVKKLVLGAEVAVGFSALMTVLVFLGGMLMLMLGLIGEYIGRIYISINNSPQYVIRETEGFDE